MNAIEINNLSKRYKDFKIEDLSLSLPGGCIMGLIGENGAGKSTVMKLILNIAKKNGGSITILGKDNTDETVKDDIGVVLDECCFPSFLNAHRIGKIMKNIYKKWDEQQYKYLLDKLQLPENKKLSKLSKGMKMKLSIAVALSHNCKLLILDEPTSGLDPVVRDEIIEMLNDFTRDESHSILISSHIVSDLEKLCDYIAFIHNGELMLCEEKDVLLSEYGILRCSEETLFEFDNSAVKHKKITPYGAEAIVKRDSVPEGLQLGSISIEELFVSMIKETR